MGDKNDNGERLCGYSVANGLVITGTLFQRKDIHKATWVSANTKPPTKEEIKRVVQTLKNGKAPEIDQITPELFKVDTESPCVELRRLFDLIWLEEKLPEQWKQGLISKIPKKGNLQQCGNWRGVTLLPIASKVLRKILINRIKGGAGHRLRKEQAGFRPGRGTVEQIFILRNILEQVNEWNATTYFHFVDFDV